MKVSEAIKKRRSIRKYLPKPIPDDLIYQLLESARLAPSGVNVQPWCFIVVTDEQKRQRLQEVAFNQKFIGQAPVVIACCGDRDRLNKSNETRQELIKIGALPEDVMDTLSSTRKILKVPPNQKLIVALNTAIAIEHIVLQAVELGLGTCWVRFFEEEKVKEILNIPDTLDVVALLPVGYPDESPNPRPRRKLEEIVFWNEYGGKK
ncbi:MAG: nitroreductase family protein [Methanosarcinales archaeon]